VLEKKLIFFNSEGNTINAKWDEVSQSWAADLILPENSSDTYKTYPLYTFERVDSFDFISEKAVLDKWQLFNERGINYNGSNFFEEKLVKIEPVNRDRNLFSKWVWGNSFEAKFPRGSYIKFPQPIFEFQNPNEIYQVVDSKKDAVLIISNTNNLEFQSVWGASSSFTQSYSNVTVSGVNSISILDYRTPQFNSKLSIWSQPDFDQKLFNGRKLTVLGTNLNDGIYSVSNKSLLDSYFPYYYFWEDSVDKDDNIIAILTLLTRVPLAHEGRVRLEGKNIFFFSPPSDLLHSGVKFYIPQSIFNTQILEIDDIAVFGNITTNTQYNRGDLISYNGKIYECIESYTHSINSPVYPTDPIYWSNVVSRLPIKQNTITETIQDATLELTTNIFQFEGGAASVPNIDNKQNCAKFADKFKDEFGKFSISLSFDGGRVIAKSPLSSQFWRVEFYKNNTSVNITQEGVLFSKNIEIQESLKTERNTNLCDIFSWNIHLTDIDDFGLEVIINSQVLPQDPIWSLDGQNIDMPRTIDLTLKAWRDKYFNILSRLGIIVTLSSKSNDFFYDVINLTTDYPNVELEFSVSVGTTANFQILNSKQTFVRIGPQFSLFLNSREFPVSSVQRGDLSWDVEKTLDLFLSTWGDYLNQVGVYFSRFGPNTLEIFQKNQRDIRTLEFKTYLNLLPGEIVVETTPQILGRLGNLITSNSIALTNVSATNSFTPSEFSLDTWDVSYNAYTQSTLENFENFSLANFSTGMVVGLVNTNFIYNNQEYNLIYVSNHLMSLSYQGPFWQSVCLGDVSKIITYPDGTTFSFCKVESNFIGTDFSQISLTSSFNNATFSRVTNYNYSLSEIPGGVVDIIYQKYSQKYYLLSDSLLSYRATNKELLKIISLDGNTGEKKFLRISDYDGKLWVISRNIVWCINSFWDEIERQISLSNPYDLVIDPKSGRVYVSLTFETDLKIFDKNLTLLRNYQLDSPGRRFQQNPSDNIIWLTTQSGTLYQIDTQSMDISSTYSVSGLGEDIFFHPLRKSLLGSGGGSFFELKGGTFSTVSTTGVSSSGRIYFSYSRETEELSAFDSSGNLFNFSDDLTLVWRKNFSKNGPLSTNNLDTNLYSGILNKANIIDRSSGQIRISVPLSGDITNNIYNPQRGTILFLSPFTGQILEISVRVTILEPLSTEEVEKLIGNYFGTLEYDYIPEDIFWLHVREFVRKPREYYGFQKSKNTELIWQFQDKTNTDFFLFDFTGDHLPTQGELAYTGPRPLDTIVLNKFPNKDPEKKEISIYQQTIFDKLSWQLSYVDDPEFLEFGPSALEVFVGFSSKVEGVSENTLLLIKKETALWESLPSSNNYNFIHLKLDIDTTTGNTIGRIILDNQSDLNFIEDEEGIIRGFWKGQIIQVNFSDTQNFTGQYISYNNGLKLRVREVYFREILVDFVEDAFIPESNVVYNFPSDGVTTFLKTTIKTFDRVIGRFRFRSQTNTEDIRLGVEISNTGKDLSPEISWIFKNYDINEQGIDWNFLNPKRKEYLIIRDEIFNYVGSYRALINAINFFGYNDLTLNEYYKNVDQNSPNFNKLFKVEIPDIFDSSIKGWSSRDFVKFNLPNPKYTGTKLFNLAYKITDKEGNNVIHYSVREALVKLHGLKKWLEKNVVPITHKILDITGEAYTLGTSYITHRNYDIRVIKITDGFSPVDFSIDEAYLLPVTSGSYVFNVVVDFFIHSGELEAPFSLEIKTYKTYSEWEPFKGYSIGDRVKYFDYIYESQKNNNKINNPRKYENTPQWNQTINYQPGEIVKWKELIYIYSGTQSIFEYGTQSTSPLADSTKWLDITIWKRTNLEPVQSYSQYRQTLDTFNFTLDTSIDPFISVKTISENGRGGYFVKKKNYEIRWIDNRALPTLFLSEDRLPDRNIYTTTTTSTTTICPDNCITFTFCEDVEDVSWFFCKDDDFVYLACEDDFSYCIDDFIFQINDIPISTTTSTTTTLYTSSFRSTWLTSSPNQTIILPLVSSGNYNFNVNWGDGVTEIVTTASQGLHTDSTTGTYSITITGQIEGWNFGQSPSSRTRIISIQEWGPLNIGNLGSSFYGCSNLDLSGVSDTLDLTGITNLVAMFQSCINLTTIQNLNLWNVSSVTMMSEMFAFCDKFNQDISSWDVRSVTNMYSMFLRCNSFNQPLDSWDVSSVTNMTDMFFDCFYFNQSLNSWDVSSVTNMSWMFSGCQDFNQPLNSWDVSLVTNMEGMFFRCSLFNQSLNSWNVSSVTTMYRMFYECSVFNQPLNLWNVNSVTNMSGMFKGCLDFNRSLNSWNVCLVNNMTSMFQYCQNYDQDISTWKVPLIQTKPSFFDNGTSFNWTTGEKPQWGATCI